MNIDELISFIGHTSTSDKFVDFLHENGIKKVPKGDSTVRIASPDKKISLEFSPTDDFNRKSLKPALGSGWFAFRSLDVHKGFNGVLPFGLSFDLKKNEIDAMLGMVLAGEHGSVETHYKSPYLVVVFFNDKKTAVETFRFIIPDKYHYNNLKIQ